MTPPGRSARLVPQPLEIGDFVVAKGVYEQAVVVAHDVGVGQREVRELLREAVVVASNAGRDGFLGGERDQGQVGVGVGDAVDLCHGVAELAGHTGDLTRRR